MPPTPSLDVPARLALLLILAAPLAAVPAAPLPQPSVTAFHGARLIDGTGALLAARGVLVVRDGRIAAVGLEGATPIPEGADSIDLAGRTVMPGLVNAHGHVGDTQGLETGARFYTEANLLAQLRRYAAYGVTTVASLGGDADAGFRLRDASWTPAPGRARLLVAGPVITAATPEAARADVARLAASKPDIVKIRVDDNLGATRKMPLEVAAAVIEEAHRHGLRVAAHIFYLEDAKALVRAGVDLLAHSVRDRPVDAELIALMRARDVCLIPTLTREVSTFVYERTPGFFDDPFFLRHADPAVLAALGDPARQAQVAASRSAQQYKAALEVASANLRRLAEAGVPIAFGTDTGPPARFQGYFEHLELALMAKAGVPPPRVLATATGEAARCLRLDNVGVLRPGALADFLVLDADPLADINATTRLGEVWIGGMRVDGSAMGQ